MLLNLCWCYFVCCQLLVGGNANPPKPYRASNWLWPHKTLWDNHGFYLFFPHTPKDFLKCIWVNYSNSLTWNKAILGQFTLHSPSSMVRSIREVVIKFTQMWSTQWPQVTQTNQVHSRRVISSWKIAQSGKTHAITRMAHAYVVGGFNSSEKY